MKKISYIEFFTLALTIFTTFNLGINIRILAKTCGIDSWICIIITYIFGLIPLLIFLYISNYQKNLNIFEKNKVLFGTFLGNTINIFISIILFLITLIALYNIASFITTQLLYHTPIIITSIVLISLAIYCETKGINVISHTAIILTVINIFLFITSNLSIISNIKLDNLLPILKTNKINIIMTSIKLACLNILPIISLLIIPKNKITEPKKYTKWMIISYISSAIISLITIITTITILGINLTKTYEFSEYMVLKKVKLFGFLERTENILSLSYISQSYIYITLLSYTISKNFKKRKHQKYTNIIIGILLISLVAVFKNITIFNHYIEKYYIYVSSTLIIPFIIISIKIFINSVK